MHTRDYPAFHRRHFLKHMAGLSLLALPGMQFLQRLRAAAPTLRKENKSLIILWMSGGPSHMDTWDLKPNAPAEVRGLFRPIATSVPVAWFFAYSVIAVELEMAFTKRTYACV